MFANNVLSNVLLIVTCVVISKCNVHSAKLADQLSKNQIVIDTATINKLNAASTKAIQSSLDLSLTLAKKAAAQSDKIYYKKGKGDALINMATCFQNKGNYSTALTYALQALQLFEQIEAINSQANAYVLMALIYKEMAGNERTEVYDDKGIAYSQKAYDLFNSVNDTAGMVNSLSAKGTIYRDKGIVLKKMVYYDSSYVSFRQAISMATKTGKGEIYLGKLYNNISQVYIEQKEDYDSALIYLYKAVAFNEKKKNVGSLSYNYGNISESFLRKKNSAKALYYAQKMLDVATASKRAPRLMNAYISMYKSYEMAGLYDSALHYYVKSSELNDSLSNIAKTSQVLEMQTKYETEKKELIIAQLDAESANKSKRITWLISCLCIFIALVIWLITLYNRVQKQKGLLGKQADKLELMMKELHHRVKNNLQIVSSLLSLQTYKLSDKQSIQALQASGQRVQAMSLIHQRLYKKEELTSINIKEYITDLSNSLLSSYGYDLTNFNLLIDIKAGLMDVDKALPLGLILNELITNALKYAYQNVAEPALYISLVDDNYSTVLCIKDNGKDFNEKNWNSKNDSFGKQLIATLCKQLRAKQQLLLNDGTAFIIEIVKKAA
jgi:two-component sensor histidine kinase